MLIGNRIDIRMINSVELTAVLAVAGSMIRAADNQGFLPLALPSRKQASKFPIHIAQGCRMALEVVMRNAVGIKIIRIMDGIHIKVQKDPLFLICRRNFFQQKIHLVFSTFFDRTGKGRIPVAFLKITGKYLPNRRTLVKKSHAAHSPGIVSVRRQPFHNRASRKAVSAFRHLISQANLSWKK